MNAVVQHIQPHIPLASIIVSKTNPRKTFDQTKLEELTGSVKLQGVLQPILVRPIAGSKFEIVAGERRYKAAKAAGLEEIPAHVRELTDAQALELQVIENNQREDLHPLEEAEGYEQLLKCKHPDGTRYTVVDIAGKVGRTRGYVYQKLKLCALCPEARKAFYDGKIDFSKGLLLGRVADHNLQRQALKEISQPRWQGEDPMSFRQAQHHMQANYMLALTQAPFDTKDVKLVPKAGSCAECPKRTGNAPELFGDVKSGDVCTDPACFKSKKLATVIVQRDAAIAAGRTVITGKAAKAIKKNEWALDAGYVKAADRCFDDPKQRTYAEIVGKVQQPLILEDPHKEGALLEIFKLDDIKPIMKEKGAVRQRAASSPRGRSSGPKARGQTIAPAIDAGKVFRERLFLEICAKLPDVLGKDELQLLAKEALESSDLGVNIVANALLPKAKGQYGEDGFSNHAYGVIEKSIPQLDGKGLSKLTHALLLSREIDAFYHGNMKPEQLLGAAKRLKIDADKVKKTVDAEIKAKAEADKVAAKEASAKKSNGAAKPKRKAKAAKKHG